MKNYYIFTFLIILSGCGGGGGGQSSSTPAPQNNPPDIINTNFEYEVIENVSFAFDVLSTDPDGDPISYEINSGDDQSLFSISDVGSVYFINSPDLQASSLPFGVRSTSTHPVNLFCKFHSLCPCLIKIK